MLNRLSWKILWEACRSCGRSGDIVDVFPVWETVETGNRFRVRFHAKDGGFLAIVGNNEYRYYSRYRLNAALWAISILAEDKRFA